MNTRTTLAGIAGLCAAMLGAPAQASGVYWSIGIHGPVAGGVVTNTRPIVVQPAPVHVYPAPPGSYYYAPAPAPVVIYQPLPVHVYPAPVTVAPIQVRPHAGFGVLHTHPAPGQWSHWGGQPGVHGHQHHGRWRH